MSTRIILADDHNIMREGLRALLESQDDFEVLAEADNGRDALKLAQLHRPEVIIIDIAMPSLNGIDATRQITSELPHTKVIGLSMHCDRRFVSEMLKAGASGYLLKDCAFEELVCAIRTVVAGKTWLSPGIAGVVIDDYVQHLSSEEAPVSILSSREREVLQMLAEGQTTKQIALQLSISPKTIETHRANIMHKLDMHSLAELTKYAVREGLTSLEG